MDVDDKGKVRVKCQLSVQKYSVISGTFQTTTFEVKTSF